MVSFSKFENKCCTSFDMASCMGLNLKISSEIWFWFLIGFDFVGISITFCLGMSMYSDFFSFCFCLLMMMILFISIKANVYHGWKSSQLKVIYLPDGLNRFGPSYIFEPVSVSKQNMNFWSFMNEISNFSLVCNFNIN